MFEKNPPTRRVRGYFDGPVLPITCDCPSLFPPPAVRTHFAGPTLPIPRSSHPRNQFWGQPSRIAFPTHPFRKCKVVPTPTPPISSRGVGPGGVPPGGSRGGPGGVPGGPASFPDGLGRPVLGQNRLGLHSQPIPTPTPPLWSRGGFFVTAKTVLAVAKTVLGYCFVTI